MKSKKQKREEALVRMEGYSFWNSAEYRRANLQSLQACHDDEQHKEYMKLAKGRWLDDNGDRITALKTTVGV